MGVIWGVWIVLHITAKNPMLAGGEMTSERDWLLAHPSTGCFSATTSPTSPFDERRHHRPDCAYFGLLLYVFELAKTTSLRESVEFVSSLASPTASLRTSAVSPRFRTTNHARR